MIDAHVQYRCRPRLSPHPIERAVSCYQRSAKGGNTPAWEWNSCWMGVKKLKVSSAGGSISHLFSVFFNKIQALPAGIRFLYESEWQSHSDHSRGTTDTKMLRVLFLITHDLWYISAFLKVEGQKRVCLCVTQPFLYSINSSLTDADSGRYKSLFPDFQNNSALILRTACLYYDVYQCIKRPYDTPDTGVYNKYWKLSCLHSYIFRNV